jgi:DNA-binding Lrp family transcriptional regulator
MIFGIPTGTEFQLIEFFNQLKRLSIVNEFRIPRMIAGPVYRNPDFSSYDPTSENWKFKTSRWARGLKTHTTELQQLLPSNLNEIHHQDLVLLRLLTEDARRPQKALAKELHVPEYQISRRFKFLSQRQIISDYDVFLGRKLFRHAPGALFEAVCSLDTTRAVAKGLETLPFQASFLPVAEGFLLYAGLPSPLFTEIGASLLEPSKTVGMMWTDYDTSMRYYFDESPFVEERGEWETNSRFVTDEPLSALRRKLGR